MKESLNDWLNKFYCFLVSVYSTCGVHALSNEVHLEFLSKNAKVRDKAVLASYLIKNAVVSIVQH